MILKRYSSVIAFLFFFNFTFTIEQTNWRCGTKTTISLQ